MANVIKLDENNVKYVTEYRQSITLFDIERENLWNIDVHDDKNN